MDKLKTYFVEVVLKNVTPKVVSAILAYGITFLIAHQEFLAQMGITYYGNFNGIWNGPAPTGRLLVMEIDTFGVWGGAMLVALVTAVAGFIMHHTTATVTGKPQSGDQRMLNIEVPGGKRSTDAK